MKALGELLTGGEVHTHPETATVQEAVRTMHERRVGAVLVVDAQGKLEGIFTERDLMSRVVAVGKDPAEVRLSEVMTRELVTASPDRKVQEIALEMSDRHIRHVPVVDGGEVIGILSLRDLLRAHLDEKVREVDALTAYIQGE